MEEKTRVGPLPRPLVVRVKRSIADREENGGGRVSITDWVEEAIREKLEREADSYIKQRYDSDE